MTLRVATGDAERLRDCRFEGSRIRTRVVPVCLIFISPVSAGSTATPFESRTGNPGNATTCLGEPFRINSDPPVESKVMARAHPFFSIPDSDSRTVSNTPRRPLYAWALDVIRNSKHRSPNATSASRCCGVSKTWTQAASMRKIPNQSHCVAIANWLSVTVLP